MAMKFKNAKNFAESVLNDNNMKTREHKKPDALVDLDVDIMEFVLNTVGYVYEADNFKKPEVSQEWLASCYEPTKILIDFCKRCADKASDMCSYFSDVTKEEWLELFYAVCILTSIKRAEEHISFRSEFVTRRAHMLMIFAALTPFEAIILNSMSKSVDIKIKKIAMLLDDIITSLRQAPFIPTDTEAKGSNAEEFIQAASELIFDNMKVRGHLRDTTIDLVMTITGK